MTIGNAAVGLVTRIRGDDPKVNDQVLITHRHGTDEVPMNAVDDERIDGLRVRQYACGCGFGAAVLSPVEDQKPGLSWPFRLEPSTPTI